MMGLEHPFTATGRDPLGVSGAVAASEAPQGALVLWRRLERRPLMPLAPPGTCMLTHALLALQVPVPPAIARLFGAADGTSAAGSSAFDSDAVAFVGGEGAGGTQTATHVVSDSTELKREGGDDHFRCDATAVKLLTSRPWGHSCKGTNFHSRGFTGAGRGLPVTPGKVINLTGRHTVLSSA